MSAASKYPDNIRNFIEQGAKTEQGLAIFQECLEPVLQYVGVRETSSSGHILAISFGLGSEIVRHAYVAGTQEEFGPPPLPKDQALKFVLNHSIFSGEFPEYEHVTSGVTIATRSAYAKGYSREYGDIA